MTFKHPKSGRIRLNILVEGVRDGLEFRFSDSYLSVVVVYLDVKRRL